MKKSVDFLAKIKFYRLLIHRIAVPLLSQEKANRLVTLIPLSAMKRVSTIGSLREGRSPYAWGDVSEADRGGGSHESCEAGGGVCVYKQMKLV